MQGASRVFNASKEQHWVHQINNSLYTKYRNFLMEDNESASNTAVIKNTLINDRFTGFQSDQFGEISLAIVKPKLFDKVVDENANKLV